jgi:hypothetical protein
VGWTFGRGVAVMDYYTKVKIHAVNVVSTVLFLAVLGYVAWSNSISYSNNDGGAGFGTRSGHFQSRMGVQPSCRAD